MCIFRQFDESVCDCLPTSPSFNSLGHGMRASYNEIQIPLRFNQALVNKRGLDKESKSGADL